MKYKNMPPAQSREGDGLEIREAIAWLLIKGVDVRRPLNNPHQLKVSDDLSFYAAKKTIMRDGDPAHC